MTQGRHGARPVTTPIYNKYTIEDAKRWRQMWKDGLSLKGIGQLENVGVNTITKWLSKEARGEI